jgi:hypothetical protein
LLIVLITFAGAIDLSIATIASSGARRRINEFKHSATLEHRVLTIV